MSDAADFRYNDSFALPIHHPPETRTMTKEERDIMRYFRQYRVGANEMLFFNTQWVSSGSSKFQNAMDSLIKNGWVVKERRRNAYSLTTSGFQTSLDA
jgi:hypothetical protein